MDDKNRGAGRKDTIVAIGLAFAALLLIASLWFKPQWPLVLIEIIWLILFCPNFNVLGGSCGPANPMVYVLTWSVFFSVLWIVVACVRRSWTKARRWHDDRP